MTRELPLGKEDVYKRQALKKAGINPAHVDSEDHMESKMAKGWIIAEDIAKAKELIATVSAEKAAHLPEEMIQNIPKGRLAKFLKEVCLLNQENIMDSMVNSRPTSVPEVVPRSEMVRAMVHGVAVTARWKEAQRSRRVCSGRS